MLLENIDRRMNPGWLINSNCIMQSVADRWTSERMEEQGTGEEEESSEGKK